MNRTPWAGGLTSDRLPPARKQRPQQSSPGPGKPKTPDLPKSSEVLRLEGILNDLASGRSRSVQGCFCQARTHPLSVYTPICTSCGLILCTLHPVHLPCPSCSSSLLTPAQRNALIVQIQSELDETLAAEARERQRVAEAARTAAGAFPALPTAANSQNVGPHKVLSLNAKTGKAMLTSYRTPSPASAPRTPPTTDARDDRVPAPPNEVPYFKGARDSRNVWTDLTNADPVTYVDKPREKGKGKAEAKKGNKQG